MASKKSANMKPGNISQEQLAMKFNQLRQEQRNLLSKINELEMDQSEHNMVIENLKDVDPDRKCFRLVGGVLVERTVKDVLPALSNNKDQIIKLISKLKTQLQAKCEELSKFKEEHNITVQGEKPANDVEQKKEQKNSSGILVANAQK